MNILKKISLSIRFLGLTSTLRTLFSTLHRDMIEWRFREDKSPQQTVEPGPLRSKSFSDQGARFEFTNAELDVYFLKPDFVRLTWHPGKEIPPYAQAKDEWDPVSISHKQTPHGGFSLSSEELTLTITSYGKISIINGQGQTIRTENPPQRTGERWSHEIHLEKQEKIHGLGEKAAPLDLRAGYPHQDRAVYEMRNQDIGGFYSTGDDPLYLSLPLYLSRKKSGSYLAFYENPFWGEISLDHPGQKDSPRARASFQGGTFSYYVAAGSPSRVLQHYTELTGRPPLPPRWALGYHQCRWGYKSSDEVREVVAGFQEHEMPLSAFHLDIDYMDGYRVFTVDDDRFPDLPTLSDDLSAQGIHLVAILDPGLKKDPGYSLYREGEEHQFFCKLPQGQTVTGQVWPGTSVFPDFTHSQVRDWWGKKYSTLLDQGVRGFWHDMNEPATFKAWGKPTLPRPTQYHLEGLHGDHSLANNLYGLLMNRAGYQGLQKTQQQQRPWILSRSGWAGNQRYAWNWTGDVSGSWEALRQTLITMLHLSLSGIPYTGSDIGGFEGHPSAELFTRWFQLAAFSPFFRGHSATGTPRRELWTYGEPYTSIIRYFLQLRYQLMPYLYTLAWFTHHTGHPLIRPLFWGNEENPQTELIEDAFYLGDDLLVAPILDPGSSAREVIFPPGDWYSFWDDALFRGPTRTEVNADLERIPFFVRAGTVLPLEVNGSLALHIYPTQDQRLKSQSTLYLDAGDGYGPHRLDRFTLKWDKGKLRLKWTKKGDYGFPFPGITLHIHGVEAFSRVSIDGEDFGITDHLEHPEPFASAIFTPGEDDQR